MSMNTRNNYDLYTENKETNRQHSEICIRQWFRSADNGLDETDRQARNRRSGSAALLACGTPI